MVKSGSGEVDRQSMIMLAKRARFGGHGFDVGEYCGSKIDRGICVGESVDNNACCSSRDRENICSCCCRFFKCSLLSL